MSHPFGDLLSQYRARKRGLSQAKLAAAIGYDPAIIGKMCKGRKELTGPSGRVRVVRIISVLHEHGALLALDEANALLAAADMPPLYAGLLVEAALIQVLQPPASRSQAAPQTAARAVAVRRTNLPAQLTSFIGREQEIAELTECVRVTRLLTLTGSGSRTALPRHQTLHAAIAWSYDSLAEPERQLLNRLAVFAGGFTAEAAEFIADQHDGLTLLSQLVDKSLVIAEVKGGAMRYRLLETIRQFASEKLVESGAVMSVRERHLAFFADLAHKIASYSNTESHPVWLDRLEAEHDNVRVAIGMAIMDERALMAGQILEAAWELWFQRGYLREGLHWLKAFLSSSHLAPWLRASALIWCGWLNGRSGNRADAEKMFRGALELAIELQDEHLQFHAEVGVGWNTNSTELAMANMAVAVNRARRALSDWHVADALVGQGAMARIHSDYNLALAALREGLILSRRAKHDLATSVALQHLAVLSIYQKDYVSAQNMLEESIAIARRRRSHANIAEGLAELARLGLCQKAASQAVEAATEAIKIFMLMGNLERLSQCLMVFADLAWEEGRPERATRILATTATTQMTLQLHADEHIAFFVEHERLFETLRNDLNTFVFEAAWAEGRAMSLEQAIDYALGVTA